MGIVTIFYLDDILIVGKTKLECKTNTATTLELFIKLGFIINFDKSILVPQQVIQFLGFIYNTRNMCVSLPDKKVLG